MTVEDISLKRYVAADVTTHIAIVQAARATVLHANGPSKSAASCNNYSSAPSVVTTRTFGACFSTSVVGFLCEREVSLQGDRSYTSNSEVSSGKLGDFAFFKVTSKGPSESTAAC